MNSLAAEPGPSLWRFIPALGIAQVVAWGSLYYSIAVLARPMGASLGLPQTVVYGGFTLALLLSGLAAPVAGRRIDRHGGRGVLSLAALLGAAAFATLALARAPTLFFIGWALAGLAMGCGLYDAAMAALNQLAPGSRLRRAVTALTLIGGFASTVFWPLSHWLTTSWDWRSACAVFAGLHLFVCLPLYRYAIPAPRGDASVRARRSLPLPRQGPAFWWLASAFALVSFAFAVLSAHLVALLGAAGIAEADAILAGTLFGPMQVLARIVEYGVAPRVRAVSVGTVSFLLMGLALWLLTGIDGDRGQAFLFAACYGASNGTLTIVRGTVPAELFGREHYGALLGRLALPSFFAKACAPFLFSLMLASGVSHAFSTWTLAAVGGLALLSYEAARRCSIRSRRPE
ncbi:MAG TPA: MFS transporter [Gammaproteobacteria bacterium]|nr:MFS transporter [Gammaproteobacteria bacterium]